MKLLVHFAELFVSDVCVDLCSANVGVTEEHLHGAKIGTVLQKICRKAVTNHVRSNLLRDTSLHTVVFDNTLN